MYWVGDVWEMFSKLNCGFGGRTIAEAKADFAINSESDGAQVID